MNNKNLSNYIINKDPDFYVKEFLNSGIFSLSHLARIIAKFSDFVVKSLKLASNDIDTLKLLQSHGLKATRQYMLSVSKFFKNFKKYQHQQLEHAKQIEKELDLLKQNIDLLKNLAIILYSKHDGEVLFQNKKLFSKTFKWLLNLENLDLIFTEIILEISSKQLPQRNNVPYSFFSDFEKTLEVFQRSIESEVKAHLNKSTDLLANTFIGDSPLVVLDPSETLTPQIEVTSQFDPLLDLSTTEIITSMYG